MEKNNNDHAPALMVILLRLVKAAAPCILKNDRNKPCTKNIFPLAAFRAVRLAVLLHSFGAVRRPIHIHTYICT